MEQAYEPGLTTAAELMDMTARGCLDLAAWAWIEAHGVPDDGATTHNTFVMAAEAAFTRARRQ